MALNIIALGGCVTHRHTLTGAARPPVMPDDVRLYLEPLTMPYLEIGLVEASSRLSWSMTADAKTDVVIKRLQREAAALGANGILLQDMTGDERSAGVAVAPDVSRDHQSIGVFFIGPGSPKVGRGTAIYVAPF